MNSGKKCVAEVLKAPASACRAAVEKEKGTLMCSVTQKTNRKAAWELKKATQKLRLHNIRKIYI